MWWSIDANPKGAGVQHAAPSGCLKHRRRVNSLHSICNNNQRGGGQSSDHG